MAHYISFAGTTNQKSSRISKAQWANSLVRFARNKGSKATDNTKLSSVGVDPFPLVIHTSATVTAPSSPCSQPETYTILRYVCTAKGPYIVGLLYSYAGNTKRAQCMVVQR